MTETEVFRKSAPVTSEVKSPGECALRCLQMMRCSSMKYEVSKLTILCSLFALDWSEVWLPVMLEVTRISNRTSAAMECFNSNITRRFIWSSVVLVSNQIPHVTYCSGSKTPCWCKLPNGNPLCSSYILVKRIPNKLIDRNSVIQQNCFKWYKCPITIFHIIWRASSRVQSIVVLVALSSHPFVMVIW